MNLVEQIFEQAKAGSAGNQPGPMAEGFMRGVSAGQQRQQLDMAKQRLAVELGQEALKKTMLTQQNQLNALKLEQVLSGRQAEIDTESQLASLSGRVQYAFTEASPTDAIPFLFEALQKTPRLRDNEHFQELVKDTQASIHTATLSKHYDDMAAERKAATENASYRGKPTYEKLLLDAQKASDAGDPEMAAALTAQANLAREKFTLDRDREARLKAQFDYQLEKFAATVPADKLTIFRERAKSIQNDLSLLADAPKRDAALKALADELGMGKAPTRPSVPAGGGFKIKVIKP